MVKSTPVSDNNFGNISFFAVGDLYHLPPVRGTAVYEHTKMRKVPGPRTNKNCTTERQ